LNAGQGVLCSYLEKLEKSSYPHSTQTYVPEIQQIKST
jgi:hypothetical protein